MKYTIYFRNEKNIWKENYINEWSKKVVDHLSCDRYYLVNKGKYLEVICDYELSIYDVIERDDEILWAVGPLDDTRPLNTLDTNLPLNQLIANAERDHYSSNLIEVIKGIRTNDNKRMAKNKITVHGPHLYYLQGLIVHFTKYVIEHIYADLSPTDEIKLDKEYNIK